MVAPGLSETLRRSVGQRAGGHEFVVDPPVVRCLTRPSVVDAPVNASFACSVSWRRRPLRPAARFGRTVVGSAAKLINSPSGFLRPANSPLAGGPEILHNRPGGAAPTATGRTTHAA